MKKIIEVKNLIKYYKNIKAVDDISFDVYEGSLFAFLGENGAGKSTTINVLSTVLEKNGGKVYINGFDLDLDPDKIRNSIGIVFQGSVLDGALTVKENLITRAKYYGLDKEKTKSRILELDKMLDLNEILKRRYDSLSGGQKRRADIARALINKPKLIFLDEPTTGLDPKTRKLVWEVINKLRKEEGLTVFLTTHYMEETITADEVVIIDHGHIVAAGTPSMLKTKYTKNKLYWYTNNTDSNIKLLEDNNLDYEYNVDYFVIPFINYKDILEFIYLNKDKITNFEVIKGNMDDVFLTVTGRKLGE